MKRSTKRQWLTLWVPVILTFVLVSVAWAVLIKIAKENPVEVIEVTKPEQVK